MRLYSSSFQNLQLCLKKTLSNLQILQDAKIEVIRLRTLIRQHESALRALLPSDLSDEKGHSSSSVKHPPHINVASGFRANEAGVRSPSNIDFTRFENFAAGNFKLDSCPKMFDYISNEFSRFAGPDNVLDWSVYYFVFPQNLNHSFVFL